MKQQKNGSGGSALVAALCIVIYLFALVQAAVRLYLSIEDFRILAGDEFSQIKKIAVSAGSQGFMDDRFIQTVNGAFLSSKTLEALIITGSDQEYAFEKQKGRAITWVYNSPRFINRLSFSNVNYNEPLQIDNIRNANIKAIANAFDYPSVAKILKETLLLILIGFAVSFFTMIIKTLLSGGQPVKETYSDIMPRQEPIIIPPQEQMQPNSPVTDKFVPIVQDKNKVTEDSGPKGLYSPRTQIGWEEYTKERLDAEIHRCASGEKDITFITIGFSPTIEENALKTIVEEASPVLSGKDMLFECGNNGIYAILPGVNLDEGISKSEKFYQRVMQINPECELNIGLSSRSGRLINADRIMLESSEALQKAKSDTTTSIIAFKSDPDKYRAFISREN